ncbi:MAG: peptide transporter [Armatimonadota bacterium]
MSVEGSTKELNNELPSEENVNDLGQPLKFEEGFTAKAVIGGLFIAFIMLPGALYLGLVAGQTLGGAAQWVTIVLFAEIAKRSFVQLKRQEIYMLFYVTGGLMAVAATGGGAGGAFGGLIWSQYFVQSPQAGEIARMIPHWVVPPADSPALANRTFLDPAWTTPILLLIAGEVLSRMNWLGMGYLVFRMTSDVEKLPFPMAPVAVAGATALTEAQNKEESWRWQVFSIGTMIGLVFGVIYLAVPIFTGVVLSKPLMLIPIPFIDLTKNTENILPSALTGISGDLTNVLIGFVIPYEIVAGMFASSILAQIVANPILQKNGLLPTWRYGMGTIESQLSTNLDFWMSVGIGVQIAIAIIGIYSVVKASMNARRNARERRAGSSSIPAGRGDFPVILAFGSWFAATIGSILICHSLVPKFPWWILVAFGLVYSPIMSYVSARMFGLTGMGVAIPFVREAAVFKSGYTGFDIWFAPIPINDVGAIAQRFREVELTGTKFTSILKAEAFMLPVMLIASFLWWSFFWHSDPIPSPQFTFAQKFWPVNATMQSMWFTAFRDREDSFLFKVLKPDVMVGSGVGSIMMFMALSAFKVPALYFYGFAAGIGGLPHTTIPTFIGAVAGKYYFGKRFGADKWRNYAPVLLAGFSCGMGLTGMSAIALAMISKSVSYLPY